MPYQEVHITDLQPGSYVVQVLKQSGDITVKHAGWVRSAQAVTLLQQKGVQLLLIDPAKQLALSPSTPVTDTPPETVSATPAKALFTDEQPKAERALLQSQKVQRQLLEALWPLLKPGGRLLYCTCSVFKAEGDAQIQAFLARNSQAQLLASPGHLIPGIPAQAGQLPDNGAGDHDGFFYALLQKHA